MQMIGCDLHARQQTLAILDTNSGVLEERILEHEGDNVREFYGALEGPVRVGIEATGSMQWFLELMEELGVEYQVGHPAKIRACEPRKQKHDRRDALLLCGCSANIAFRRSGCPRSSSGTCEHCCSIDTSGYAFALGCRTRCSRLP